MKVEDEELVPIAIMGSIHPGTCLFGVFVLGRSFLPFRR
jgi:hypothetical protein